MIAALLALLEWAAAALAVAAGLLALQLAEPGLLVPAAIAGLAAASVRGWALAREGNRRFDALHGLVRNLANDDGDRP